MKSTENIEQSIKKLTVASGNQIHDRVLVKLVRRLNTSKHRAEVEHADARRIITMGRVMKLAAACLIVSLGLTCFVQSRKVADLEEQLERARAQQNVAAPEPDNSATINLYLREHQEVVARHASLSPAQPEPMQMRVSQDDILYYENFEEGPEYMRPGIIVRGPSSPHQLSSSEAPVISNGHAMSLSEAKETAGFDLVAPPWLDPGFALDEIRTIEGRDALQLLYTNGIDSVSLFEQSLDGRRGLSRQDFREYGVYSNAEQTGGTILAWRNNVRSYVLIGNVGLSQLMDMAQSLSEH